jgi:hypothetical protein
MIFILCLVTISLYTNSQGYHKLIRTNTYWDVFYLNQFWYDAIDKIYFTGIDTIFDGKHYKLSREYPYEAVNPGNLIPPFIIDTTSTPTNTFLREDTILKRVYIYDEYLNPNDQIIYDFSLSVGDTLHSDYCTDQFGNHLTLTFIDTVTLLNGEIRKRFNFQGSTYSYYGYYIEGIGGDQGLFSPIVPAFEQNEQLGYFCVSQNGINLWGDQCNWYFVGVNKPNEDLMITIFPNPAHDKINVTLSRKLSITDFIISDIWGTEILHENLSHPNNLISISPITPGIYIYQLKSGQFIKQGKIIIF